MEDAVDHRSLHEGDHPGANHSRRVDAGALHALDVVEREARQPLHDEHAAGDERRVRSRNHVPALAELGEHVCDVEHVLGLEAEVELLGDRLGEELDQRGRVRERRDRDAPHEEGREPRHHCEVLTDELRDLRALHLHDDVLAGSEGRRVDLRDRSGGERDRVEGLEHLFEGAVEVLLDDQSHGVEALRGHPIAAELELAHELLREQSLARGDDLPELDVRRPQVGGRDPQPARDARRANGAHPCGAREVPSLRLRARGEP